MPLISQAAVHLHCQGEGACKGPRMKAKALPLLAVPASAHEQPVHSQGACKPPQLVPGGSLACDAGALLSGHKPHASTPLSAVPAESSWVLFLLQCTLSAAFHPLQAAAAASGPQAICCTNKCTHCRASIRAHNLLSALLASLTACRWLEASCLGFPHGTTAWLLAGGWKPPGPPSQPGKGPEQPHAAERPGPSVNGHQVPAAASAASAFRAAAANPAPAALRGGQLAASPASAIPTNGAARAAPSEPQHAAAADSRDLRLSRCQVDTQTEAAALSFLQADVPTTGPHRLILFDLETTGEVLLCKLHNVPHSMHLAA